MLTTFLVNQQQKREKEKKRKQGDLKGHVLQTMEGNIIPYFKIYGLHHHFTYFYLPLSSIIHHHENENENENEMCHIISYLSISQSPSPIDHLRADNFIIDIPSIYNNNIYILLLSLKKW